ncbi:unnamed protein product [Auanema sp. JU1783]|nr:unnamed protein product [Auanema sp. JU1783]
MVLSLEQELKGGHPPANKVGGRRVMNKKDRRTSESEITSSETSDEPIKDLEKDTALPGQMDRCYPTTAVKLSHEKPVPQHQHTYTQNPPSQLRTTNQVFQPRKHT